MKTDFNIEDSILPSYDSQYEELKEITEKKNKM
jgi:hypothetical protein